MSVRVFAPAKINLTLQVGRPRSDGLHPLQSVVAFADVGDWIEARPAEEFSLTITGLFASSLAADDDNLVLRAARLFAGSTGLRGAALTLEKNLPVASGIGGGSSDAAATLNALTLLSGFSMDASARHALAASLGADVPVCLDPQSCYMEGVGERVTPMRLPVLHAVLINAGAPLPTSNVYREFDRQGLGAGFTPLPPPDWRTPDFVAAGVAALGNDLLAPACALAPDLARLIDRVRGHEEAHTVAMSGSGATVFALTANAEASDALAKKLSQHFPAYWLRPARLGALDGAAADR